MKNIPIALGFATLMLLAAQAQDSNGTATIEGLDTEEALRILEDLEGLQEGIKQVNQLGRVVPREYATLRFLDKLNAEVKDIGIAKDQSVKEAYLTITLKACYVPSSRGLKDAAAYLLIEDEREKEPVFDGWMIASSPALSAMDHPRYDVWVDNCSSERPSIILEDAIQAPPARP